MSSLISVDSLAVGWPAVSVSRALAGLLGVACPLWVAAAGVPLAPEGNQYAPAGSPVGDQLAPQLAFRANGGCLVWHDNLTDGDGFGVSARRLSGQLAGLSSLRVNEDGAGDQENPQVAILADGGNLIVWQSGVRGAQVIRARVLGRDGRFSGPEFTLSQGGTDSRNPVVTVAGNGTCLVAWTADDVDGDRSGVLARRLSADGNPLGDAFVVNEHTEANQRDPVLATTGNGSVVIAWISELQRSANGVDVYARRLSPDGEFRGGEFVVNTARQPCTTPALAGLDGAGFVVAWSEHQDVDSRSTWDVKARVWGDQQASGADFQVNTRTKGYQLMPKLAVAEGQVLVVYRSEHGDGYSDGVVGQWITASGALVGSEMVINTVTAGHQMTPSLAADASGRLIVIWSTFAGSARGMDLAAQRFARPEAPLVAPGAPYLFAASSSRLIVTWPEVTGLPVVGYDVFVNGSTIPVRTTTAGYSITGLAPSSQHEVRVSYVLSDGRKSPLSEPASARTWGEDDNADGLPDDWQRQFFGSNAARWPASSEDSDNDGVSDRIEFLSGTNPVDPTSLLQVALVGTPQGLLVSWNTRPGAVYQPQWSVNLQDWNNLGNPRLAADVKDSLPAGDTPAPAYYRVNLLR